MNNNYNDTVDLHYTTYQMPSHNDREIIIILLIKKGGDSKK